MIKIKEAMVMYVVNNQKKLDKCDFAMYIYPGLSEKNALGRLNSLLRGSTVRVDCDLIVRICKYCGVDANFIFGMSEKRIKTNV